MNTALSQPPSPAIPAPVPPVSGDGAAPHPWLAALCSSSLAAFVLVLGAHAAALGLMLYPSASAPTAVELPTIQGILIPAPPAETVQLPSAQETPPPVETPPPEPVKPKPQPKPKPEEAKPVPAPEPVVEAPPSENAITAETAAEEAAQEESAPVEQLPVATANAEEDSTLGAPVTPPQEDAHQLNNPRPAYPSISRRLREQGTVLLEVLILANGTVGEVRIKESSGYNRLDQTAMRAVKQWRYLPARRGTETIDYWYLQPVEFALN